MEKFQGIKEATPIRVMFTGRLPPAQPRSRRLSGSPIGSGVYAAACLITRKRVGGGLTRRLFVYQSFEESVEGMMGNDAVAPP